MNKLFVKRFIISVSLGLIFGFVCVSLASGSNPDIWMSPLMWSLLFNRLLIGIIIAIAGVHTVHPLFGFRMYPVLRGTIFGILVSVDIAIGAFISNAPNATSVFWLTILAGGIYGMIIDLVATKFSGEGVNILGK